MVTSLKQMEEIVLKNHNLYWSGWDVVERKPSKGAMMSVNGIRVNDIWYMQKVFPLTKDGWDIPRKYRR